MLGQLRFDKMKPVRDATLECLKAFKESPELDVTEEDLTQADRKREEVKAKIAEKKEVVKRAPRFIQNGDPSAGSVTINGVVFQNDAPA